MGSPVHRAVGVGRQELSGSTIEHVEEAVAVHLHRHLAQLTVNLDVGEYHFPHRIPVKHIVGRRLIMPDNFTGLRTHGDNRRCIQIIALAVSGIPGTRIAGAPIHQVKLGIIGTGDPGTGASVLVGFPRLPSVMAFFSGAGGGVTPPQMFTGLRVPAIKVAADTEFSPRDARYQHTVGHQWRCRLRIPLRPFRRLLPPYFLAGLLVEGDHIGVQSGAENLAVINSNALVRNTATHHARRLRREINRRAP